MRKTAELIGSAEASRILGQSRSQINRRAADGELPTVQKMPGDKGAYLFDRSTIEHIAVQASPPAPVSESEALEELS